MNHILDETYQGHELVFIQQDDGFVTVDIRSDDFDGEMLQGYTDMLDVNSARLKAVGYVDGYEDGLSTVSEAENEKYREDRRQGRIDT